MAQANKTGDMSSVKAEEQLWDDEEILEFFYAKKNWSKARMADLLGCSPSTIHRRLKECGITRPWKDEEKLRKLYLDEQRSTVEIADRWDCAPNTVRSWLQNHNIPMRTRSEACQAMCGSLNKANFNTSPSKGYEYWAPGNNHVYVHRLMMVAEHGFDEVADKHVHHKNGIEWDNRFDNLELVTNEEHRRQHLKVPEEDRVKIADEYEHTDKSSYTIAGEVEYDISPATVREIHGENYE